MSLLFSNDAVGQYPNSFYAARHPELRRRPDLRGHIKADVVIVGAGYTGLSAALHLAEAGADVVVLDAQRVGFGASGRNGGQLGSGLRRGMIDVLRDYGQDKAGMLWGLAEDAKNSVKTLIRRYDIACELTPGVAETICHPRLLGGLEAEARCLQEQFGYAHLELRSCDEMREICPSPAYFGGLIDWDAAHLDPFAYVQGLARACDEAGARIFERSLVHRINESGRVIVHCDKGQVQADTVILAGNGYLGRLSSKLAARVMPINNFIVASEPLGARQATVLARDIAIADSKFVINYFRLSKDGRLLFGGGESYGYRFPQDIAAIVRKAMLDIFPHLADLRIDYAWGGTLAITRSRYPHFAQLSPNVLGAAGYSGHGIGTATHAGALMARAVLGDRAEFEMMASLSTPPFPGGGLMRTPLLALAMTWYAMRDRFGL